MYRNFLKRDIAYLKCTISFPGDAFPLASVIMTHILHRADALNEDFYRNFPSIPPIGLFMKIAFVIPSLLLSLVASADTGPARIVKTVPAWAFLWQLAEIKAPKGCAFSTPGMDGSNYDPSKPFTIVLTDARGNSDSVVVQSSDNFNVVVDMATQVVTTSLDVAGKELVTISNPSNGPNANTFATAKVGEVVCGVSKL